jgi:hypothetical protein
MAGIKNWKVDQATNFAFSIIYKDSEDNPIDLTQYRVFMDIKSAPGSKKILASATQGNGITVTPLIGRIDVNFSPEKTAKIAYPKSAYDLVIEYVPNGQLTRLLEGWLEISRAVTVVG